MGTGISVVVTVLDDRVGLAELLPALAAQSLAPQEIVIVDAGSTDGSLELVDYWRERGLPLRLLRVPGTGISAGRNRGIVAGANDRIAVTDAGCRPAPGWLAALARELERCEFVAGTYTVDHATPFEHAVAVTLYPDVSELGRELPLPTRLWLAVFGRRFRIDRATGRSMAFRRSCWEDAGGFPEHVDWGEDVAFSAAAVDADAYATIAPDAVVAWRGRRGWRENALMYWRYAQGEAMLGVQPRGIARGLAWTLAAFLGVRGGRRGRALVCAGAGFYSSLPMSRARQTGLPVHDRWRILAVLAMKDLAMLAGTVSGVCMRRTGAEPDTSLAGQPPERRPAPVAAPSTTAS